MGQTCKRSVVGFNVKTFRDPPYCTGPASLSVGQPVTMERCLLEIIPLYGKREIIQLGLI